MVDFYGFHVGKYTVRPMDASWDIRQRLGNWRKLHLASHHQTVHAPKMKVLTYISCMDTAYGYGKTHPQNSLFSGSVPPF